MNTLRLARAPVGLMIFALIVGFGLRTAVAQDSIDDLRAEREESRRDAAAVAAELDALAAEDAELVEALAAIDAHIALQESKVAATVASIEEAEAQVALTRLRADELGVEIAEIRTRLQERAVDAYVAPGADDLRELNTADLVESALRRSFLEEIVGDEYELVDQLRVRVAEQEAAQAEAEALAEEAEREREELEQRLTELDDARLEAEELRVEVQVRVADWQRVSDEMAEADRLIAQEIVRLEEEARRLAAEEEARRLAEEEAQRLAEEEARRLAEEEAAGDDTDPDETDPDAEPGEETEPSVPEGPFAIAHRPVSGPVTSPFGDRIHPIFGTARPHYGIDFDGDTGEPIVAAADGIVLSAGWINGYGNTVVLSHGDGYTTLYAHQTDLNVVAGATVGGGTVIGWVGSTGWSTGSHLHFEVRLDGVALDPARFL